MLVPDQSRLPPGRSIRLTSSAVNGAYRARHAQKSSASLPNASVSAGALGLKPQKTATQTTALRHWQAILIAAMITFRYPLRDLKSIQLLRRNRWAESAS